MAEKKNTHAEKILKFLTDNKGTYFSRAEIEGNFKSLDARAGLAELRADGKVKTEGERRGMKYAAK